MILNLKFLVICFFSVTTFTYVHVSFLERSLFSSESPSPTVEISRFMRIINGYGKITDCVSYPEITKRLQSSVALVNLLDNFVSNDPG